MEGVVALFIPIISTIVIALAFVTWIYFRSKEKQMIIERGLDTELVKALFERKKSPYALLKIGIVILFFGIGLGIGLLIEVYTGVEQWIPFLLFALCFRCPSLERSSSSPCSRSGSVGRPCGSSLSSGFSRTSISEPCRDSCCSIQDTTSSSCSRTTYSAGSRSPIWNGRGRGIRTTPLISASRSEPTPSVSATSNETPRNRMESLESHSSELR